MTLLDRNCVEDREDAADDLEMGKRASHIWLSDKKSCIFSDIYF